MQLNFRNNKKGGFVRLALFSIIVFLFTPWFKVIFDTSILLFALLVMFYLVLLASIFWKRFIFIAVLFNIFLLAFTLPKFMDTSFYKVDDLDKGVLQKRFDLYGSYMGKLYLNGVAYRYHFGVEPGLRVFEKNFFENLDPNNYFFKSHPRERSWAYEFQKISPILILFVFLGFGLIAKKEKHILIFGVFNFFVSSLYSPTSLVGPINLLPFFFLSSVLALDYVIKKYV